MRKLFYFTSILLITAGMTFAQAGGSTSSTPSTSTPSTDQSTAPGAQQTTPPADQSGSSATSAGTSSSDQTSISGCISKSGDNFVLTDQNGTAYKLDGSGLDAHVGHQASLTGSMGSDNKFKVSDVKMISESCSTTGASATGASTPSSSDNSSTVVRWPLVQRPVRLRVLLQAQLPAV